MAVIKEEPYVDEGGIAHPHLVRHYSDEGKPLIQNETGSVYEEAIDTVPCAYTYSEYEESSDTPVAADVVVEETVTEADAVNGETDHPAEEEPASGGMSNLFKSLLS